MGNTSARPHPRQRNKKQVHWRAADRPSKPGRPQLVSDIHSTPDVITIRWDRPIKDGGSPISGYLVEHRRLGSPHWVRATPLLVPFPEVILSGLEPGWRYQFRVSAENAVGLSEPSDLSEPLTVTLQRSAVTSPRFTHELSDTTALENEKVEFVVYFLGQPPPKISWFKDGFEIFSSRRIRILSENDRSVLTIHQSQLADAGEIRCSATNKAGHATTNAILILEAPPSIRLPRQYEEGLLFEIGEVIRLKISVAGLPVPLVFWSHNGESIQSSERHEIENLENSTMLKINEATRSDRGEYQVKAVNKLGQDQASFLVTVTDKPSQPGKARVLMTLGRSVTLAWNSPEDDGGCKIGNYIIEYYRLGWDVWLKAATSRQLTAVLGELIEGSQYKFRVKAESPYGISEPSEATDVVFIPDTKRGIFSPPPRSASQPRDVAVGRDAVPELPQRKNKPRSQSSSRVEDHHVQFDIPNGLPIRPERIKPKSPQRTPDPSPKVVRRDINPETINKNIFDRASMTRDFSYGIPELIIKKNEPEIENKTTVERREPLEMPKPKSTIQIIDNRRPRSPSPTVTNSANINAITNQEISSVTQQTAQPVINKSLTQNRMIELLERSRSPTPQKSPQNGKENSPSPAPNARLQSTRSPSPNFARKPSKDFTGSSEFMLVLLPNENKGEREASDIDIAFDENQIPPPLSLSAPELGTEPPVLEGLKYSASSTELLHERAMIRFYEAAEAEERELKKKLEKKDSQERRSIALPKIKINSQDEEDYVNLERKASLRRRYSAGINAPQQILWSQRRHSLRNSDDLSDVLESKLRKYPMLLEDRRDIMMERNRSESEEKEENEFRKVRDRMIHDTPHKKEKKAVNVADLNKWEQYEESLSEEESSEDERIYDQVPEILSDEDEETTYNPRMRTIVEKKTTNEPFEILTKPNKLPDPNFVPKPILKRSPGFDIPFGEKSAPLLNNMDTKLTSMPLDSNRIDRRRSSPILDAPSLRSNSSPLTELKSSSAKQEKRGSLPWSAPLALSINEEENTEKNLPNKNPLPSVSAIASISGIAAAAGVIIPRSILARQTSEEEAKVVADHYADIVRNYGQKKNRPSVIRNYETDEIQLRPSPSPSPPLPPAEFLPSVETKKISNYNVENKNDDNVKRYNESVRSRTNSSSSSQRSSSPSKLGRIRRGSPTVLNKDVAAFRVGRDSNPPEQRKVSSRTPSRTRTPSKSPSRRRQTNDSSRRWNETRYSPTETSNFSVQTDVINTYTYRNSPSPVQMKKPPKMKEIMTQTSTCLDTSLADAAAETSAPFKISNDQELKEHVEKRVRTTIDYVTDLAMFIVACWLYLFNNELLAIPVLLVMVYRQLESEVRKRIPKWLIPKRKKGT